VSDPTLRSVSRSLAQSSNSGDVTSGLGERDVFSFEDVHETECSIHVSLYGLSPLFFSFRRGGKCRFVCRD